MADYALTSNANIVLRNVDHVYIPNDAGNVDWQKYQTWLGLGNTPDLYVPPPPSPQQQFINAIAAGLKATFNTSSSLTAIYAIDAQTQLNFTAEVVSILTNNTFGTGQTTRLWADISGQYRLFNMTQFKALATAVNLYVNTLYGVVATLETGQQTNWPVNELSVNA